MKAYFRVSGSQQIKGEIFTVPSPVTTIRSGKSVKSSRLEKSPFNMVNPPNKTIIDAMHGTFSDMNQVNKVHNQSNWGNLNLNVKYYIREQQQIF